MNHVRATSLARNRLARFTFALVNLRNGAPCRAVGEPGKATALALAFPGFHVVEKPRTAYLATYIFKACTKV
jgi:hypothetical protein